MAYYDENGRITIDEVAANNDINKLKKTKESLEIALRYINQIKVLEDEFQGNFVAPMNSAFVELEKGITELISIIEALSLAIDKTVKKYRQIDDSLAKTIVSTLNDGGQ